MNYWLHPEAASEHEEQVAFYEDRASCLGSRYHTAFRSAILQACKTPKRFKVISAPEIRSASINGFPYSIVFREKERPPKALARFGFPPRAISYSARHISNTLWNSTGEACRNRGQDWPQA